VKLKAGRHSLSPMVTLR